VHVPPGPTEAVIALSIVFLAVEIVRKGQGETGPTERYPWAVAFFFGLFHGLGFATVMGHLPFRMVDLVKVMVTFNVGVELGQLAIVLVVFPVLYLMRKKSWFVPVVVHGGSAAIAAIAAFWMVERIIG
ncbi:MAG: HupE/UreJ family protein, partial [Woeseiaceae bacterium]|nr:HupE/UreJ family protein [Woeseiaceae bacterium]